MVDKQTEIKINKINEKINMLEKEKTNLLGKHKPHYIRLSYKDLRPDKIVDLNLPRRRKEIKNEM